MAVSRSDSELLGMQIQRRGRPNLRTRLWTRREEADRRHEARPGARPVHDPPAVAPYLFADTFPAQAPVAAVSAIILFGVRVPAPTAEELAVGRQLGVIAGHLEFITAVTCGVVSYQLMNFLMTAASLAMRMCGPSQASSNLGIQSHVIAMYAPSFFTGRLKWSASQVEGHDETGRLRPVATREPQR